MGGARIGTQVALGYADTDLILTKLMVVGKAKAIHMALAGDSKGEVGATEGILEPHMASASPGLQHHTPGDQESFCRQEEGQSQQQTDSLSSAQCVLLSSSGIASGRQLGRDSSTIQKRKLRPREHKCLTQTPMW